MQLADIQTIMISAEVDEWSDVPGRAEHSRFYKADVNLRLEIGEYGAHRENFREEWANKHSDPSASSTFVDLYYGQTIIERFILVSVDGGRAKLPLPERTTLKVKASDYFVASLFNDAGRLDDYMKRSGLSKA